MDAHLKQYFVAVSEDGLKLPTLVDLLLALLANGHPVGVMVSCGSRDSLDRVVGSIRASVPQATVAVLHADLLQEDLEATLQAFVDRVRLAREPAPEQTEDAPGNEPEARLEQPDLVSQSLYGVSDASPQTDTQAAGDTAEEEGGKVASAQVLVTTDVLFKQLGADSPLPKLDLLIDFDLPLRKEQYLRQVQLLAGEEGDRKRTIVIYFVVAGQIASFRHLESFAVGTIDVMPVHVSDIFAATPSRHASEWR